MSLYYCEIEMYQNNSSICVQLNVCQSAGSAQSHKTSLKIKLNMLQQMFLLGDVMVSRGNAQYPVIKKGITYGP